MTFLSRVFQYVSIVLSFFFRTATLDNVSEMVSGKVFQASFRPVSDLFWAWH